MTLNFLSKKRLPQNCAHAVQMKMEIAGMSREVCETCGRVRVGYVQDHAHHARAQLVALTSTPEGSADA